MTELIELGILNYKSVESTSVDESEHRSVASYYKVKQGTTTAPRLDTRIVKMHLK